MKHLFKTWFTRLRPAVGLAWRLFPIKISGLMIIGGAGLLAWFYGLGQRDLILLLACLILGAVALIDVVLVCLGALLTRRWWKRCLRLMPSELAPVLSGLPGRLPLSSPPPRLPLIEVSWRWLNPGDAKVQWQREYSQSYEEFVLPCRGAFQAIEREFEIADVLGFASIKLRYRQDLPLTVLPQAQPLNRSTLITSLHAGDDLADPHGDPVGDRVDMRQYAAGDPPKLLLWKIYARSGRLMVRQSERATCPKPRTCAYLVAGPLDEAAAGLARAILELGVLGTGWRFGADGNRGSTSHLEEALHFLARSGNVSRQSRLEGGTGLKVFLDQAARDGFNGCLVLVPSRTGPWLERVQQSLRIPGLEISLAATPSGLAASPSRSLPSWWRKVEPWLLALPAERQVGEPEEVLRRLAGVVKESWLYHPQQRGLIRYRGQAHA